MTTHTTYTCKLLCLLIMPAVFATSCQSATDKANEVINAALQMEKIQNGSPASDSVKLSIQTSIYTNPVKKAPTQEELIKKYKVKRVKHTYESGWYISTYDKKGNKISEESDYSGKKTFTYKFDKDGRVIYEKTTYKDGSTFILEYKYNEESKVTRKAFTNNDGETTVTTMEYNSKLNTRTEISANGVDKEFYDNRGLRVRFESYDDKKKMIGHGEATYDEEGLKKSENAVIMGMNASDEYEYNEIGQLLKQHRTGILDVVFVFEYDKKGLMTSEKTIKGSRVEETIYTYTYY